VLRQVLHDEPRPPRRLNDAVPRDLETVCLKAMSKEPGGRYPAAHELADDLRRWLNGEPVRARPASAAERAGQRARRTPVAAVRLGVSVVAFAAVVAFLVSLGFNSRLEAARAQAESARQAEAAARADEEGQRVAKEAALELAEARGYSHRIALADLALRDGNQEQVNKLLDECPPR